MITTLEIPRELMESIREFMLAGKTGNFMLDIKHGEILAWNVTAYNKVPKVDKETCRD